MSMLQEDFTIPGVACTLQEDQENKTLKVTLLSSEWKSSTNGDLSTVNRELAIQLAKHPYVDVSVLLPNCSEADRSNAESHNVKLVEADRVPGFEPVLCLSFPPTDHTMDCVIGHGVYLGRPVALIKRNPNYSHCKWIQVVHSAPEEDGTYRNISEGEQMHETEIQLCKMADQVITIGPKLAEAYKRYLRPAKQEEKVFDLTPSIFSEFLAVKQATEERRTFCILVIGSGDNCGDFNVKGYDIAAKAIAELKDKSYKLKFACAAGGKGDIVAEKLLYHCISRNQLIVRSFDDDREVLANLFCEMDLAIMPSRTEGFGIRALEALSAGLPVLVSGNSGLGEALKKVSLGSQSVVDSEDPKDWAKEIKRVRQKERVVRLSESHLLREKYLEKYNWEEPCKSLVIKMKDLVFGKAQNTSVRSETTDGNEQECGGQLAGNLKGDPDYEDHLLKLKIKAIELNDEQEKEVGDELIRYATIYFKNNKVSSGFFSVLQECYNLSMKTYGVGCLEITVQCTTLGSLKLLWRDFLSGHLDKLAEEYLVSSTIKTKLDVDIVKFKVTIKEEDYLACKTSFLQHSGAAPYDSTEKAQRNTKDVWTATEEAPNTSLKRQTSDGNEQTKSVQGAAAYESAEQAHRNTKEVWTAAGAAAYDSAEQAERNTKEVGTAAGATPYDSAEQAQRNTREVWTATAHEKEEVPYYTSGKGLADDEDATVDTEGNQKTLIKSGKIGDKEDTWHLREAGASIKLNSGAVQLPLPFTCRCLLWNPKTLSPPTASDEILVSSVIELSHDGPPDLDYGESIEGLSFTLALLHRAPDLKGYEVVIKQLIDQENNEWKELKTENTWHGSETSTVPKWLFPFAQAVCAKSAVSSFAAIWRPKSFTFSRGTAVGPELTCIVPDFPDVSVQIPQSCVPFNEDFSVTIKVQEFPSSELKGEERLVGPGLYISGSQNVTLVAPVTIRIPLTLRKEKQELAELCSGELRILHCESLVKRHDWKDITDQLDEPPRLLDGIVQFKVRYFSGFRPIKLIRSLLQSASGLKKFVRRLFSSSRRQHARFLTCLCETRVHGHFGLKIFCYPQELQDDVKRHISNNFVAYIGEGSSVRPVCVEERILVSLSEAIIPQDTDDENGLQFVRFLKNEVFYSNGEVCLESGRVPKVMFYGKRRQPLCNVIMVPNRVNEEGNDIHMVKDGEPTDCELEYLSFELAEKWETLARRLEFNQPAITNFDKADEWLDAKAFKMLQSWKQREGSKATYTVLYNALCHDLVECKRLAEKFCCDESVGNASP